MPRLRHIPLCLLPCLGLLLTSAQLLAADATFFRAVNLNGPALVIDGHNWEGTNATNFSVTGKFFENQTVALKPATDPRTEDTGAPVKPVPPKGAGESGR